MNDVHYGRKRSGIKRELDEKLGAWLQSITDEDVRKAAHEDVIVTGGAIASMLLGESINDFDLYFRTKETAKRVAEYYVAQFNQEQPGYSVKVQEETLSNIKGEHEDRVTIFISSDGVAQATEDETDTSKKKYRPIFLSQNAVTLSDKVQLVIRFYGEPQAIHSNYDFVHAKCYYDYHNNDLTFPPEAMEALLSRTLVYEGSLYPVASIFRMKKFIERGWRITAGQQLKIMWQISEIDLSEYSVLREQLTGVDAAYMHQLISALEDVDPEKITSSYVGAIIDRIFD